jgi:protein O-GlcNAc transferase
MSPSADARVPVERAFALVQAGRSADAAVLCDAILAADPGDAAVLHLRGALAHQAGDARRALDLIDRAIAIDPGDARYHYNRGTVLITLGQPAAAADAYGRAATLVPDNADARFRQADALARAGRIPDALLACDAAIAARPDAASWLVARSRLQTALGRVDRALADVDAALAIGTGESAWHAERGTALIALARDAEALEALEVAVARDPGLSGAHLNRGVALRRLGRLPEAIDAYDRAITLRPGYADALFNRGNGLAELGRAEEALDSFRACAAAAPNRAEPHAQAGAMLSALGRHEEALAAHAAALARDPGHGAAARGRARALAALDRLTDALAAYDEILARDGTDTDALHAQALILLRLRRVSDVVHTCDRALAHDPDHGPSLIAKGNALRDLRRHAEALRCFDAAITRTPGDAVARYGRANTLFEMRRYDEAADGYGEVARLDPGFDFIAGTELFARLLVGDWSSAAEGLDQIAAGLRDGRPVVLPFAALSMLDAPELHRRCAETYAARRLRPAATPAPRLAHDDGRIRVGYFSSDYHAHATTSLIAQLFEVHDRVDFEISVFSYGPPASDAARARIRQAADRFHDVSALSDEEVAALSNRLGLDIAVDLKGYTTESRLGMFALRCAPVQMSYLGYPGTLAMPGMDYVVADAIVVPPGSDAHFTERIIRLPGSYQVNDRNRPTGRRAWSRSELGLPDDAVVFACFNNCFKILPETFDGWMRILAAVDGGVLWLLADSPRAVSNLRDAARARGIDPDRIIFAPRMNPDDHIARHRCADLFLDTLPYNAHTTASDALWAGLPVLTRAGRSFAARVAASLLHAVGLPELVTDDQATYEARAIALARDPAARAALRARLAANRDNAPLFDAPRFARGLETAYRTVHARHRQGLPPAAIDLSGGAAP